jgi:hypothetical protein
MTNKTLNKIILSATTAMFLTACGGGGGSSTPTAQEKALAVIQAYADDNSNPEPTVADYTAAGLTSVTTTNLAAMNQLVDSKTGDEVDELSELTTLAGQVDVTAPVITLLGSSTVSIVAGTTYTDAGATATDDKDGSLTVTVGGDTVDIATPGTYTITYNVSDAAGNAATEVTRVVTVTTAPVLDTTAPVITLVGDATIDIVKDSTYTDAGATASDDTDGVITGNISVVSDVNENQDGTYHVTYNVADAAGNNAVEVTRTVIVHATQFVAANGEVKDIVRDLTWKNAITDTNACPAGFTTPTVEQFQTIIDYSKDYTTTAVLLVDGFDTSLTTLAVDTRPVKTSNGDVDIRRGSVHHTNSATDTICVKGTWAPATDDFTPDVNNTVKDNNTGLVWSDNVINWASDGSGTLQTFVDANATCDDAEMRLPTLVELDSIYNRDDNNISSGFNNVATGAYWSTTEIVGETTPLQWTVNFNDNATDILSGQIYGMANADIQDDAHRAYVRCVK